MTSNTVRTVVMFSIIGLVLVGAALGGVQLLKARNHTYASVQTPQKPQDNQTPQKAKSNTESQQKEQAANTNPAPAPQSQPSSPQTPSTSTGTTPPAQQPSNDQVAVTGPTHIATTGPSIFDFAASTLSMMLAIFFGAKVIQARALVRKYLS